MSEKMHTLVEMLDKASRIFDDSSFDFCAKIARDSAARLRELEADRDNLLLILERLDRMDRGLGAWHEDARAEAWQAARNAIAKAKKE
jgi:regulator of RNase E activity RraB